MCGIAGFIDHNKNSQREDLEKMTRTLIHRGPDGEGYFFSATERAFIGLGHRRLSIIDLSSAATQPLQYKNFHITFNGEVYNYAEIRTELLGRGHTFSSHSDTEVILHAYAEWGPECLQRFIGMFAFVIYDEEKQTFFAARDRAGVKPFFYHLSDGLFLFSSELKAFIPHPGFKKEIDPDAAAAFLQYGYVPAPHCIYKNTYKLDAGHYMICDIRNAHFKKVQYWNVFDAYNRPPVKMDFSEAKEETEKLLTNAFSYRMVSDVPVGIFLSGGYDSACVTALLQKDRTEKLKTFTIGMPDAGLNEAPFAKEVANILGTDHTEFYCTEKEALDIIPDLPYYYDEPFGDSSAIPTTLVSRIAREKVTVALSADGGDEIFAGYSRYDHAQKKRQQLLKIPGFLRQPLAFTMSAGAGVQGSLNKNNLRAHNKLLKAASLLHDPSEQNVLLNLTKHFSPGEIKNLFKKEITEKPSAIHSNELKEEYFSFLHYMMATDYRTYLADDILQKIDRAGMSISLEGREPFLDHRIIEWAAQLPTEFKLRNGSKKYILKQIVHKYLPEQVMDRPKMGFGIPVAKWLHNDLKKYMTEYFSEGFIKKQGIFNYAQIIKITNAFSGKGGLQSEKIWHLLMFQMWYDRWINQDQT